MLYDVLHDRLAHVLEAGSTALLAQARRGVEKESLRVTTNGEISQALHPVALGSTLTHPLITTDYSEALLEFITPPLDSAASTLEKLIEIHRFTVSNLGSERLWAASMPCAIAGEESIPIAVYGTSNSGTLRHVYRRGLALRYGRVMQIISGVHYNFSLPVALWPILHDYEGAGGALQEFISARYLGLIRNVLRYGWLILYLFGASPAVCRSFLGKDADRFSEFDERTVYEPYATSLRMSDIGYSNRNPAGLDVSYDSLDAYIDSLARAIETPYTPYAQIGVVGKDGYQQLNANILQIENEYYSTVRPKRPPQRGEKPTIALRDHGVEYVEVRSLDVDPYATAGVSLETLHFMEIFLWFCALHDAPAMDASERQKAQRTLTDVAYRGRDPGLKLACTGDTLGVGACAGELLTQMGAIAEALDGPDAQFSAALAQQTERVADPDATPSARMLAEMRAKKQSFFEFGMERTEQVHQALIAAALPPSVTAEFAALAQTSIEQQNALEQSDGVDFETYLNDYLAQSALAEATP